MAPFLPVQGTVSLRPRRGPVPRAERPIRPLGRFPDAVARQGRETFSGVGMAGNERRGRVPLPIQRSPADTRGQRLAGLRVYRQPVWYSTGRGRGVSGAFRDGVLPSVPSGLTAGLLTASSFF